MSTGVSAVATATSSGVSARIRLAWTDLRPWFRNFLRACLGDVLCLTAGEVD